MNEKSSFDIAKYLYEEYRQNWSGIYKNNCLLLANQTEIDRRQQPSPISGIYEHDRIETRGGVNQVTEFCRANNIEYREVNIKANSRDATEAINSFLLRFTKDNYNTLHAEKKNVENDTGSSCQLI